MTSNARLPSWLRPANSVVKTLQKIGLPLGTIHVLTVPGRKSGEPRSTPVSPLTVDGGRYIIAGLPESDWARNVRSAGRGKLAKGRTTTTVSLTEVLDPQVRRRVVSSFPSEVPHGVQFFVRIGLVKTGTEAEFAAVSDDVAVFEVGAS
jgi:deazaflavin-dependent oxidoreductase (nitroreductase family)